MKVSVVPSVVLERTIQIPLAITHSIIIQWYLSQFFIREQSYNDNFEAGSTNKCPDD